MKNFLSAIVVAIFCFLALASRVNKMHTGTFNTAVHADRAKETYVVLNDGTRVCGEKITTQGGLLRKEMISIDDQNFKKKETRGYMLKGRYYVRQGDNYLERFITGKLNVYFSEVWVSEQGSSHQHLKTYYYYQRGDDGELHQLGGQQDIKKAVADCPAAVEMASKSDGKMRRAIKADRDYVNSIFHLYNRGCK